MDYHCDLCDLSSSSVLFCSSEEGVFEGGSAVCLHDVYGKVSVKGCRWSTSCWPPSSPLQPVWRPLSLGPSWHAPPEGTGWFQTTAGSAVRPADASGAARHGCGSAGPPAHTAPGAESLPPAHWPPGDPAAPSVPPGLLGSLSGEVRKEGGGMQTEMASTG